MNYPSYISQNRVMIQGVLTQNVEVDTSRVNTVVRLYIETTIDEKKDVHYVASSNMHAVFCAKGLKKGDAVLAEGQMMNVHKKVNGRVMVVPTLRAHRISGISK